jgi:TRAP-type C4-dicarboxylate transport system substrate-binding protein
MGGYGPPTTSFSRALTKIGDRLSEKFGDEVDVKYVYNVMDVGYTASDVTWLVDTGVLTFGYFTMTAGIPELELAALPFLFPDSAAARAAMDGELGRAVTERIESQTNYRVLGYFENGFRHISNRVRPVHTPADLTDLTIRVLGVQARTFELLGADPQAISLADAITGITTGTLDGQENPFANTVTYGIHPYHQYHTATYHSYLSRPIFVHRPSFETWPETLQQELQAAVHEAVAFQRDLHDQEETEAEAIIRAAGGEIVELTPEQKAAFVEAVAPIYDEARAKFDPELLSLVDL